MSRPSTNGIVIVGAGPYGLSVAAHLRRYGLPFRIFGSPMQTWRSNMPAGMFLKSEGRASSLSEPSGSYTLRSHCEQYGLSYGEHGVPVPLETFSGRDVTVIGGGQSALETAAPAREQGANVHVFARQPRLVWNDVPQQGPRPLAQRPRRPTTGLGDGWRLRFYANSPGAFHRLPERMRVRAVRTALGPAGAWWLKERVLGQLPVLTGHTVLSAEADGDRLRLRVQRDDGRVIDQTTEHLIAGTGYRVDLSRLSFLGDQLRWRLRLVAGAPALSSSFEASAPDLYFVGLASAHSFGPAMRFLYGADYSARRLVRHLLARAAGAPFLAPAVRWSMVPSTQFALWSGSPRVGDDGMTDEYKASIL
jgi:hypothetical protein